MSVNNNVVPLAHWRRSVAELYAQVREETDHEKGWAAFVAARSALFKEHPKTPLTAEQRRGLTGLNYFPYDWRLRVMGRLKYDVAEEVFTADLAEDGLLRYQRVASVHFRLGDKPRQLYLYWIVGYGGGLFLPFGDQTNGRETYAGGRYLYDTIKGADLGAYYDAILMDFNYAYNPSCAYSARWTCPLPPDENRLDLPVRAGEKEFAP